ncbi:MAG: hypothetical protein H0T42_04220 [Deltaproteobacteria bacterium]|nr:hypothetical protein [Deltaproteobacteria bacterium]
MLDVRTCMRGLTLVIIALVAGCKDNATCDKFVDMSMKCPDTDGTVMSDEERSQVKGLLVGMCQNAMHDSTLGSSNASEKMMMKEMNATIRKKAECVAAAASCEDAKKCGD